MKKNKLILRVVLLAFVAAAIGTMFLRDRTSSSSSQAASKTTAAPAPGSEGSGFVAYYFHGTRRCPTCRAIEAQAQEAIQGKFAEDLRQGRLRWAAVNLEDIGNDHYATDYGVTGSTLVIAQLSGGRPARFAKLENVWRLVHDKPAFVDYVTNEVTAFLKAKR
jgi:hypothetical protein